MNWLLMGGAAAGAFAAIVAAGLILVKAFVKAVETVVYPEFLILRKQHEHLTGSFLRSQEEQDEDWERDLTELRDRVETLAENFQWLKTELKPNHGSSLRDAIDRIESRLQTHLETFREVQP